MIKIAFALIVLNLQNKGVLRRYFVLQEMLIHTYSFYKSIKSVEGYVRPFDYTNIPFKMIPGNTSKTSPFIFHSTLLTLYLTDHKPFSFFLEVPVEFESTLHLVVQMEFKRNVIYVF